MTRSRLPKRTLAVGAFAGGGQALLYNGRTQPRRSAKKTTSVVAHSHTIAAAGKGSSTPDEHRVGGQRAFLILSRTSRSSPAGSVSRQHAPAPAAGVAIEQIDEGKDKRNSDAVELGELEDSGDRVASDAAHASHVEIAGHEETDAPTNEEQGASASMLHTRNGRAWTSVSRSESCADRFQVTRWRTSSPTASTTWQDSYDDFRKTMNPLLWTPPEGKEKKGDDASKNPLLATATKIDVPDDPHKAFYRVVTQLVYHELAARVPVAKALHDQVAHSEKVKATNGEKGGETSRTTNSNTDQCQEAKTRQLFTSAGSFMGNKNNHSKKKIEQLYKDAVRWVADSHCRGKAGGWEALAKDVADKIFKDLVNSFRAGASAAISCSLKTSTPTNKAPHQQRQHRVRVVDASSSSSLEIQDRQRLASLQHLSWGWKKTLEASTVGVALIVAWCVLDGVICAAGVSLEAIALEAGEASLPLAETEATVAEAEATSGWDLLVSKSKALASELKHVMSEVNQVTFEKASERLVLGAKRFLLLSGVTAVIVPLGVLGNCLRGLCPFFT